MSENRHTINSPLVRALTALTLLAQGCNGFVNSVQDPASKDRTPLTSTPTTLPTMARPGIAAPIATPTALPIESATATTNLPSLETFTRSVETGNRKIVTGAYSPDHFAIRVVQQHDSPNEVAYTEVATQFDYTSGKVIGLLTHDIGWGVAGDPFNLLQPGDEVDVVMGDGGVKKFQINGIEQYQAVEPYDPNTNLVDTNGTSHTSADIYNKFYQNEGNTEMLTLQTCFTVNGNISGGRVFYTGIPLSSQQSDTQATSTASSQ